MDPSLCTRESLNGLDILFFIPPPYFTKMPNLGVATLASFLKGKGYKTDVCDLNVVLHNQSPAETRFFWQMDCTNSYFVTEIADKLFRAFEKEFNGFTDLLLSSNLKVIGFSVNIISIFLANRIARMIKARDPSRTIIFGGAGTYYRHPRELIEPGFVDYFVIGEGEGVILRLLEDLRKSSRIPNGPGVLPGSDNGRRAAVPAAPIPDLDSLPHPTYAEFPLARYNEGTDYHPIPLLMSRGCINRCSYCIDCLMWPKYRVRSPRHMFDEIEYHCRVNAARAFEFNDLLCNGDLRRMGELSDLIIRSGLRFDWVSYAVIRKDMSPDLLAKMRKAGCHTLIYGVEHTAPNILKKMNKHYTADEAQAVIRLTHEAGICTNINIIVGFPGETDADLDHVVRFLEQNKPYIDEVTNVSGCTLFPEADLGRDRRKFGVVWEEGTDPMLFKDTAGLDRHGRNRRVERLLEIVNAMGLKKSIVNRPKLNPLVKE